MSKSDVARVCRNERVKKSLAKCGYVFAAALALAAFGFSNPALADSSSVIGDGVSLGSGSVVKDSDGGNAGYLADKKTDDQAASTWTSTKQSGNMSS